MKHVRRCVLALMVVTIAAPAVQSQALRDKFAGLFVFGSNGLQLFLPGTADPNNPANVQIHGKHFLPASVDANGSLIGFISNAIAGSASNTPMAAASSGTTFGFEGGVPIATSASAGPVFGERAPTLGRGRVFVGFSQNSAHYSSLRGVDMNDIRLVFTHQNVTDATSPGCSAANGGDCGLMGIPKLENDVMNFKLGIDMNVTVRSFAVTYGLLDRLDVSFLLPLVSASMKGRSDAQIVPFGGPPAVHFFAGTPDNPVLNASQTVQGDASGIGDVATRLKLSVSRTARSAFSLLVDARFPTGSADDLLGSGHFAARALAIMSARFGDFTPHANLGYLMRTGDLENGAVLATAGFDHLLAPWATLALDLVSEFQVGASKVKLPGIVKYDSPFKRTVDPTNIPEMRDDLVNASIGMKFRTFGELTAVTNVLLPVNKGGLRPNYLYTFGLEYGF